MSARRNPQLWYGGSAPDKNLAPCDQIARVRRRALEGAASLAYFEWSAALCTDECPSSCTEHDDPGDPQTWAKTNPGLGIRIDAERIEREHESMSAKGFARERLSVGHWPSDTADQWSVIPERVWRTLADSLSEAVGRVAFAIDATPGGTHATIATAGLRADGLGHSEVIDHRQGTGWVTARIKQLRDDWDPIAIVIDPGGPAGHLIPALEQAGVEVLKVTAREVAAATESLISAAGVAEGDVPTMRYMPHPALDAAVAGAETTPLADARKWNRKSPTVDISPLVAITLARHGLATHVEEESMVPLGAVR